MKDWFKAARLLAFGALIVGLAGCGSREIPEGTVISVIYSADTHGRLEGCGCKSSDGGIAHRSAAIARAREEDPDVVYCDAGNFLSGTAAMDSSKGKMAVAVYNELKPQVVNVCERELAFGLDAFKAARKDSKFDYISANLTYKGSPVTEPFAIKQVKEAKVGFVGLCGTEATMRTDSTRLPEEVEVRDPVTEARKVMAALAGKADLVILLSTCGDETDSLIAQSVPGIDLIIGGRSFRPNAAEPWVIGKTRVVRPDHDGRALGRMDMAFGNDRKIKTYSASKISLEAGGPVDDKMLSVVKTFIPNFADNADAGATAANP